MKSINEIAKWIIREAIYSSDSGWGCYVYFFEIEEALDISEDFIKEHREEINKKLLAISKEDKRICEYEDSEDEDCFCIDLAGVGDDYNLALVFDNNEWRLRTYDELIEHAKEEGYELSEDEKSYYKELMEMKNGK